MSKQIDYHRKRCDFCGTCVAVCPADAIRLDEADLTIDENCCMACLACVIICPLGALEEKA